MTPTLTVVLPVHNGDALLRRHVTEVLELVSELTSEFRLLIVDDGSTDDTYDTSMELAARYPQVEVMRNAQRRGLGPTLRAVRSQITSDVIMVHDGTTQINADQIRTLWIDQLQRSQQTVLAAETPPGSSSSDEDHIDDLLTAATTHRGMAAAHARLAGFQLLGNQPADSNPPHVPATEGPKPTRRQAAQQPGIGGIPPLPRPNFLDVVTNFARSE